MYETHWGSVAQARAWGQQCNDSHSPHAFLPIGHPASLPGAVLDAAASVSAPDAPPASPEPAPDPPDEEPVSLPELAPLLDPCPLEDPLPAPPSAPPLPVVPLPQATANADAARRRHRCFAFDKAIET